MVKKFAFKIIKHEVVARQQEAKFVVEVSIDPDKVERDARKAIQLKDVDDNGVLVPYETLHKQTIQRATDELSRFSSYRDALSFNTKTLEFDWEPLHYLKVRLLSDGREVKDIDDGEEFRPNDSEVIDFKDPEFEIEG